MKLTLIEAYDLGVQSVLDTIDALLEIDENDPMNAIEITREIQQKTKNKENKCLI